jgi:hypothetical protein
MRRDVTFSHGVQVGSVVDQEPLSCVTERRVGSCTQRCSSAHHQILGVLVEVPWFSGLIGAEADQRTEMPGVTVEGLLRHR